MDAAALKSALSELEFTSPLPAEVHDRIVGCSQEQDFRAGQVIFREGDENRKLYLILSGRVALDMHVPGRGLVRIMSLGPGDMLAWSALLGGTCMTATATALEHTRLIASGAECLRTVCDADHTVGYELMRQMAVALSRRLVATRLQLLDLFADTQAGGMPNG
jgi:CRP-like cAMP-binding protein